MTQCAFHRLAAVLFCLALMASAVVGQSTSQSAPSPVEIPEISVQIKARDIGDSRNTTYYFELAASQGDLFINVVAANFSGDIDFFTMSGLKPLAKIMVYGGQEPWETGRVVYFRQNERVLLRIEGRTPNDDPASLRIKFAGSFVAVKGSPRTDVSEPTVRQAGGGEKVSSVGATIASGSTKTAEGRWEDRRSGAEGTEKESAKTDTGNDVSKSSGGESAASRNPSVSPSKNPAEGQSPKRTGSTAEPTKPDAPKDKSAPKKENPKSTTQVASKEGAGVVKRDSEKPDAPSGAKVEAKPSKGGEKAKTDAPTSVASSRAETKDDRRAGSQPEVRQPNVRSQTASVTLKTGKVLTYSMTDVAKLGVEDGTLNIVIRRGGQVRIPLSDILELSIK